MTGLVPPAACGVDEAPHSPSWPGSDPAIHANATGPVSAWIPGSKGDLRSPSMQEDAKAKPWLWPGMTVEVPQNLLPGHRGAAPSVMHDGGGSGAPFDRDIEFGRATSPSWPGLSPYIDANTTTAAFAWIPASTGDLRSPSMQEDAKASPWLWPGMTVEVPQNLLPGHRGAAPSVMHDGGGSGAPFARDIEFRRATPPSWPGLTRPSTRTPRPPRSRRYPPPQATFGRRHCKRTPRQSLGFGRA
jgi:hypothetical protein